MDSAFSKSIASAESGSIGDLVLRQKQDEYIDSSIIECSNTKRLAYNPAQLKPSRFSAAVALKRKVLQQQQAMEGVSRLMLSGPRKVVIPRRPKTSIININENIPVDNSKKKTDTKTSHSTAKTSENTRRADDIKRDERIYDFIKSGYVDVNELLFPLNSTTNTRMSLISVQSSYSGSTAIQRALSLDNIVSSCPDPFYEGVPNTDGSTTSRHTDVDNQTVDMSVLTFEYTASSNNNIETNPDTTENLDADFTEDIHVSAQFSQDLDDSTANRDDRSQCSTISHALSCQGDFTDKVEATQSTNTVGVSHTITKIPSKTESSVPLGFGWSGSERRDFMRMNHSKAGSERRDFMRMNHSKAMKGVKTLYPIKLKNKSTLAHDIILSSKALGCDPLTSTVFIAGGKSSLIPRSNDLRYHSGIDCGIRDRMNEFEDIEEAVKKCNTQESFQYPPLVVTSLIVSHCDRSRLNPRSRNRSRSDSPPKPMSRGDVDATLYTKEYSVSSSNEICSSEFIPLNPSNPHAAGAAVTSVPSDIMDDLFNNRQYISVANTRVASPLGERRVAVHSAGKFSSSLFTNEVDNNSAYNTRSIKSEQSHRRPKLITNPSRYQQQVLLDKHYPDEHNSARGILAVKRQEKFKVILESFSRQEMLRNKRIFGDV